MKETKFKQTEIGMIPDDWEVKEIKEFADVTTGNKNTQDAQENGKYPFYVRSPIVERINTFSFDSEGLVTAGDGVGTGKVFHFVKGKFGLHQRAYLIHKFQNVDSKYFYYIFSQNFYERVHSMTAKSSVDSVRREMITQMSIPLPPTLAEQQKITKALSDVDNVISTLEKLITKKKNLKQGTMQQLLTGKKRLPGFGPAVVEPVETTKFKLTEIGEIPEDWEVKSFEELFDICTSTISLNFVKTAFYVGTENMLPNRGGVLNYENELNYLSVREYRKEDILFSNIRPYLKKLWLANHNGGCSTDVLVFRKKNKDDSALFLYMLISDDRFFQIVNDNAIGTKMPRGDKNIIKQIKFCLPSKLEQTAIANVLSSMDKEIEALEAKLGKYRDLKTGMMQQLLTGKIRLM